MNKMIMWFFNQTFTTFHYFEDYVSFFSLTKLLEDFPWTPSHVYRLFTNENNGGGDAPSFKWGIKFVYMHVFWYKSGIKYSFVATKKTKTIFKMQKRS
jgi:hypothetical protein